MTLSADLSRFLLSLPWPLRWLASAYLTLASLPRLAERPVYVPDELRDSVPPSATLADIPESLPASAIIRGPGRSLSVAIVPDGDEWVGVEYEGPAVNVVEGGAA